MAVYFTCALKFKMFLPWISRAFAESQEFKALSSPWTVSSSWLMSIKSQNTARKQKIVTPAHKIKHKQTKEINENWYALQIVANRPIPSIPCDSKQTSVEICTRGGSTQRKKNCLINFKNLSSHLCTVSAYKELFALCANWNLFFTNTNNASLLNFPNPKINRLIINVF